MDTIGERLLHLRKDRKMSQQDVAKLVNVSRPTVAQWEAGTKKPSRISLEKLSDVFNVSVDWIIGKEDEVKQVLDDIKMAVPLKEIAEQHDITWDGKVLNETEKLSLLTFVDAIVKAREAHKKK